MIKKLISLVIVILFIGSCFIPNLSGLKQNITQSNLYNTKTDDDILPPEELWNKTLGVDGTGKYIREISDGGYKIIANSISNNYRNMVITILKTDKDANIETKKEINLFENEDMLIRRLIETSDGGYLFAGTNGGYGGDVIWSNGIFLVKTDAEGNEEWNYKKSPYLIVDSINECPDGGFILGARMTDLYWGYDDTMLIKVDKYGYEKWIVTLEKYDETLECIYPTEDGGFLLGGFISKDTWVMKLDKWGDEEWATIFEEGHGSVEEYANNIHPASDDGYLIFVNSESDYYKIFKIDDLGDKISNKQFDEGRIFSIQKTDDEIFVFSKKSKEVQLIKFNSEGSDEYLGSFIYNGLGIRSKVVRKTSDNGFIFVINTRNKTNYNNPYQGFWLIKTDNIGNKVWENKINKDKGYEFYSCSDIDETSDDGYIICGSFNVLHDFVDSTLWLIKFGENSPPTIPVIDGASDGIIYENYIFSASSSDTENDKISYLFDWGDGTDNNWTKYYQSGQMVEEINNWTKKGLYNIKVKAKDEHGYESDWSEPLIINMPKVKQHIFLRMLFMRILNQLNLSLFS